MPDFIEFLRLFTEHVPPPDGRQHTLSLAHPNDYGTVADLTVYIGEHVLVYEMHEAAFLPTIEEMAQNARQWVEWKLENLPEPEPLPELGKLRLAGPLATYASGPRWVRVKLTQPLPYKWYASEETGPGLGFLPLEDVELIQRLVWTTIKPVLVPVTPAELALMGTDKLAAATTDAWQRKAG